jgi:hypothetical protein|eukprot:COSAG06_NODE_20_length_33882_cov_18.856969_14_plen_150_part_00
MATLIATCSHSVLRNLRALCGPQSQRPLPGLQTLGDSWGAASDVHPAGGGKEPELTDDFRARYHRHFGTDDLDPMLMAETFPASGGDPHELLHLYSLQVARGHPMPQDADAESMPVPLPQRSPEFPHQRLTPGRGARSAVTPKSLGNTR